jgi:hypothetical protein
LFLDIGDDLIHIDIFIGSDIGFIYDIGHLFSWELLVLGRLRDEALIRWSTDVDRELFFTFISLCDLEIDIFERVYIVIGLILLEFIIPYQIRFVYEKKNECDKYISEMTGHREACNEEIFPYNIQK